MSEIRPPHRVSLHRLPEIQGKKSIKIEQFPAKYWREHVQLGTTLFSPRIPFFSAGRDDYFSGRYRVRINGAFYCDGAKFTMLTQGEIDELVNEILYHGKA